MSTACPIEFVETDNKIWGTDFRSIGTAASLVALQPFHSNSFVLSRSKAPPNIIAYVAKRRRLRTPQIVYKQ